MTLAKNKLLLCILPLVTLVLCIFVIVERNPYCSSWSDPTFCYLFNGLNIAIGYFKVGQVDHPGTPLQIFAGACIRFFHLFSSEEDVVKDVVLRPQWYLFRMAVVQSTIVSLCMWLAGWLMLRFSGSIFFAVLIQLTHIVSFQALYYSQNLMTEFVLVAGGMVMAPFLIAYTFVDKNNSTKLIVASALICGTMLAGKISFFPVILLWVMILKSWRHLAIYIVLVLMAFLLWTIPAWHAVDFFVHWLENITTHTGKYGGGEKGFVVWSEFFNHLRFLLRDNRFFTFTFILMTGYLLRFIFRNNEKSVYPVKATARTVFAVWIVMIFQLFMVSKHFASHYVIPVHLLVVPVWIILLMAFPSGRIAYWINRKEYALQLLFLLASGLFIKQIIQYDFYPQLEQPSKQIDKLMAGKKYNATLFVNAIYAPVPQAALYFGVNYAGDCTGDYKRMLEKVYPPFYVFDAGDDTLTSWTKEIPAIEALNDSFIYYLYSPAPNFDVNQLSWGKGRIKPDTVLFSYHHPTSGGSVYLLKLKTH